MFTTLTLVAGFLFPAMVAIAAILLSINAACRHMTLRQILMTAAVLGSSIAAVSMMYESISQSQTVAVWPVLLIGATALFALAQFALAIVFASLTRLRQLASR